MYTVDIRPLLEYAAFVWDGCSQSEVENLEKVQSFAARIVTGLALKNLCISRQAGNHFQMGGNSKFTSMHKIHNSCVFN